MFSKSVKEVKKVNVMVFCGLLVAVAFIISMLNPLNLSNTIKISFSFVAVSLSGYVAGPVAGILVGGLCDVLTAICKPTGVYFFGYTFTAMLSGMIYGMFLFKYNRNILKNDVADTILKCVISRFLVSLIVTVVLNTFFNVYFQGFDGTFFEYVKAFLTGSFEENTIAVYKLQTITRTTTAAIKYGFEVVAMTLVILYFRKTKHISL